MSTPAAPIPVKTTRHQCPFCRRTWAQKAAAQAHIRRCWQNPNVRACKTCSAFEHEEEGPYPEHPPFPEGCGKDRDLTAGLRTGCSGWEAT